MNRLCEPFVIDVGGGQIILSEFRDRTSLAITVGFAGRSAILSSGQQLALAKALCDSARRKRPCPKCKGWGVSNPVDYQVAPCPECGVGK